MGQASDFRLQTKDVEIVINQILRKKRERKKRVTRTKRVSIAPINGQITFSKIVILISITGNTLVVECDLIRRRIGVAAVDKR